MKLPQKALALSTCFLALSGCPKQRVQVPLPIPAERMDCTLLTGDAGRPTILPEYEIDWKGVTTVTQARQEHQAYVSRLREREGPVAGYILRLEGQVFLCADDAEWLRDYTAELAD